MKISYERMFDRLSKQNLLSPDDRLGATEALRDEIGGGESRALSLFAGAGAWFAAICLVIFLGAMDLIDPGEPGTFVVGALIGGFAVLLRRQAMDEHSFGGQLILASSITAQIIAALGLVELAPMALLVAVSVTSATLYALIPSRANRLASAAMPFVTAMAIVADGKSAPVFLAAFAASLAIPTAHFCLSSRMSFRTRVALRPLAYSAAAFGLVFALDGFADLLFDEVVLIQRIAVALASVVVLSAAYAERPEGEATSLAIGAIAVGAMGLFTTPGVLMAILLTGLGLWRRSTLLAVLGAVGLAGHLGVYYYELDVTFLTKSAVLVGSGVVLLVLRALVSGMHDRGVTDA